MLNEKYLLRQGNEDDFIERLKEYIRNFDSEWEKNVCGATEEELSKIHELSQLKKYNRPFPKMYYDYLKNFGKNDGGVCFGRIQDYNGVDAIIKFYMDEIENDYQFQTFSYPYLLFLSLDWVDYVIDINSKDLSLQYRDFFGEEKPYAVDKFESMEKFIFQMAFIKYEKYEYCMTQITPDVNNEKREEYIKSIDAIVQQFNLEKLWFSDEMVYIARGEDANIFIDFKSRNIREDSTFVSAKTKRKVVDINKCIRKLFRQYMD